MQDFFAKLSSYNIFNYLLPGTLFAIFLDKFTSYSFIQKDFIIGAFVYYFIGLVVSRFGSLVVEPLLKNLSFLKFADYKHFLIASKKDPKIELFSEVNNMYRTFISMFLLLLCFKFYELIESKFSVLKYSSFYILLILLLIMFLYSYRKQTQYITKRIIINSK